jgi:2-methylcitrate dehydratase
MTDERVQAPDAQAMVARIECPPDAQLTARFPQELSARISVHTRDGRELVVEHIGYEGVLDSRCRGIGWSRSSIG